MKARTSSRRKRGRPPLPAELREPNGRRSRNKTATDVFDAIMRQTAREARMRVYGAATAECERSEWGYLLGRLYLTTSIGMKSHQHEAGVRMAEDYARYFGLCGLSHPHARALDLFRVHGRTGDGSPEAAQKAQARYEDLERLLIPNSAVSRVTRAVCVYEQEDGMWTSHNVALLLNGLQRLAKYYGIPNE